MYFVLAKEAFANRTIEINVSVMRRAEGPVRSWMLSPIYQFRKDWRVVPKAQLLIAIYQNRKYRQPTNSKQASTLSMIKQHPLLKHLPLSSNNNINLNEAELCSPH